MTNPVIPKIININKPVDITSYDVIRKWKKRLRGHGKIGHFGTLDPFACGVLMIGVGGAARLNEYIHECLPKTYLAIGRLGVETETGDMTVEASQVDETEYLKENIAKFDPKFIEEKIRDKFLGEYWQAPHKYSAAKHDGKALHEWAREGVEIKKEKKRREVYDIEVVKYEFPELQIRFKVSSGTYIRTLFSDCARYLGTLGTLKGLIREQVGGCTLANAIEEANWECEEIPFLDIDTVLDFPSIIFAEKEAKLFQNGVRLKTERAKSEVAGSLDFPYRWMKNEANQILGMAEIVDGEFYSRVIFPSNS